MVDVVAPDVRSRMMAGIRSSGTTPELLVRKELHRRGFRYKLHDARLPGRPDLVFPQRRAVVFVHGCFWHGHEGCRYFRIPSTRTEFWTEKIKRNRERDSRQQNELETAEWRIGVVWECALRQDADGAVHQLANWLNSTTMGRIDIAASGR